MRLQQEAASTALGVIALVLWSSMIAFSRGLAEQLGIFTAAAGVLLIGGGMGLLYVAFVQRQLRALFRLSPRYLLVGCLLVMVYLVGVYAAVGLVTTRRQVLTVGLINYLWPAFTLLLAIPLQGKRARLLLWPGMLLGFTGIALATFQREAVSWPALLAEWQAAWFPYLLALLAALAWALYSNLTRRWAADAEVAAIPLFLFLSGLLMLVVRGFFHEQPQWTPATLPILLFAALGPTMLAYLCWDIAMRKGRLVLLASLSYLTPLLSTLISGVYLRVMPGITLWLACGLVIAGAILCNASVVERDPATKRLN